MGRKKKIPLTPLLQRIKDYFDIISRTTDAYLFVTDVKTGTVLLSPNMIEDYELPGTTLSDMDGPWLKLIHPEDKEIFKKSMAEMMVEHLTDEHDAEYRVKTRRGSYRWIRCRGRLARDEQGKPYLFSGMMTRMDQRNQADHVTGLLNKYSFEHGVKQALQTWHLTERGGAIILFGLDNFKIVNETYNRSFGDEVLRYTARSIANILPMSLPLYKLDGDEFAVVYPGADEQKVEKLYADVQKCMMRPGEIEGKHFFCTVSAGTVFYPLNGKDYLVLHKYAEAALDSAKHNGKNTNCIFTKVQYNRWVRSLSMRDDLRKSVEQNCEGFNLFYQPQVDAQNHRLIGAEALLRWRNPRGKMVAPMEFIPILEQTKLIIPVGKWIFEQAVLSCKKWRQIVPDFHVSINVSYEQIKDRSFKDFVPECLAKHGLPSDAVILELTESCIVADWGFVNKEFDEFRDKGIKIAMDDFGTGYSSLGYLKNLSCDIVKIDREFVKKILEADFDRKLVSYTVALCHSIGIKVCIEGVEEEEVYNLLQDKCGVDMIQGYLFGHPEAPEIFEEKFLSNSSKIPMLKV